MTKLAPNANDLTGLVVGDLTVISPTDERSDSKIVWLCQCSCGNTAKVKSVMLKRGTTTTCGCKYRFKQHGRSGTKEYVAWKHIKDRCYNPKSAGYGMYGALGIKMEEEFIDNFMKFYEHVGDCPVVEGKRFSIDRIIPEKSYTKGNMRWADDSIQAQNQGIYKNNKTGVKGVYYNKKLRGYICTWRDMGGVARSKSFAIGKYGSELALFLAQKYRTTMMERLNLLGAGYSHYHIYGEV